MPALIPSDVALDPSSVTAGDSRNCTVTLNGTPSADQTVQISADQTTAFTNLPSSIVVAANTSSKTFSVQTSSSAGGTSPTITASCNGGQAQGGLSIMGGPDG